LRRKGYLIAIEGIDAVGKRTQSVQIGSWFKSHGYRSELMSFPDYETPIGKQIRGFLSGRLSLSPRVRHLLFAANRWEKASTIREKQDEGSTIIVNRYTQSNLAYGAANGLPINWLVGLEAGLPKANLVIVLDAPPQGLLSRRPSKDSYENNNEVQRRTRAAYKELGPKFGWKIIDATGSVQEVHNSVVATVEEWLRARKGGQ